jgi:XTP/dITP diphosphohydrolase
MAQDAPEPWTIDDLAGDLAEKLIRRNPHVFAGQQVAGVDEIMSNWEQIKKAEKSRTSALEGVVLAQPALALATKILARAASAGLDVPLPDSDVDTSDVGVALLRLVEAARQRGVDAELALRHEALRHADRVRSAEALPDLGQ